MFGQFYHANVDGKIIYCSIVPKGEGLEMSLFVNDALVETIHGETGEFELGNKGDVELKIKSRMLRSPILELRVEKRIIPFDKIKKKELKAILQKRGIHNSINPDQQQLEAQKVKFQEVIIPLVILAIGAFVYTKYGHHPKVIFKIIAFLALFIGPFMLFSVAAKRFPVLQIKKLGLAVGLFSAIGLSILLDNINYGTADFGELYAELGTEQSERIKVAIKEVTYQGTVKYKDRVIDPYYNHHYEFSLNGETFEGKHTNPTKEFNVGDSLDIYYLIRDPEINKSVKYIEGKTF